MTTLSHLHIWMGTANLGNAAPDEASWKEWIPADGYFSEQGCLREPPSSDPPDDVQQFDIIVLGMQESTFDPPSKENGKLQRSSVNSSDGLLLTSVPEEKGAEERVDAASASEEEECPSSPRKNVTALLSPTAKVVGQTVHTIGKTTTKTVRKIHCKTGQTIQSIQTLSTNRDHCQGGGGAFFKNASVLAKLTRVSEGEEAWLGGTHVLHSLMDERCPSYERIVSFQRGEMRLTILVHAAAAHSIEVLFVAAQNTGRAGLANKGGIVAELRVAGGTRLTLCTAHLEAHEGKYATRVATLADIWGGTSQPPWGLDASLTAHYAFCMGDLNFRTEVPQYKELTEEEHKQIVRDMVQRQDWPALNDIDELQRALKNKDCLVGFQTLPCNFPPTFKVERKKGYEYIDKRRPSYTDRILWKTNHGMGDQALETLFYEPIENFTSSDHKPIRAAFRLQLNEPYALRPKLTRNRSLPRLSMLIHKRKQDISSSLQLGHKERFHLFVSEMSCQIFGKNKSLRSLVPTVPPNPYLCVLSDPPAALQSKVERGLRLRYTNLVRLLRRRKNRILHTCFLDARGFPRSSMARQSWNPSWNPAEEIHTEIQTHHPDGSPLDLTGATLRLTVMDHLFRTSATGVSDVVLGTVVVHLVHLLRACQRPLAGSSRADLDASGAEDPIVTVLIDEPLLKNGVETGHLKAKVEIWWMDDRTAKSFAGLGRVHAASGRRGRRNNHRRPLEHPSDDRRLRWSEGKRSAVRRSANVEFHQGRRLERN